MRLEALALIEVEHGAVQENDPGRFRRLITIGEQSDGMTDLTPRQMHPAKAPRDTVIGFGAVEYAEQMLTRLTHYLAGVGRGELRTVHSQRALVWHELSWAGRGLGNGQSA